MYVAVVPNRGSPPAILLRESYREAGKTKNRTLANLSRWPAERIEQLRAVLRGDQLLPAAEAVEIVRALPHGHVLAALGTARRIALDAVLPRRAPQRRRDLALALIVARLLEPAAKLATARMLDPATASHSLGEMLGLGKVAAKELYAALDWLGREQPFIEATLARRHLQDGALLLYDVTSTPPSRGQALSRRALLRTGAAWLQPRPPWRPAADCHWPDVRGRRLPGGGRGVRGQYRRSGDAGGADRQAEAALQAAARGDGGRPRRADQRADRADAAPGRSGLDHRAASPGDQAARRRGRAAAALAV